VELAGGEIDRSGKQGKIELCVGEGGPGRSDEAVDIFSDGNGGLFSQAVIDSHRKKNHVD